MSANVPMVLRRLLNDLCLDSEGMPSTVRDALQLTRARIEADAEKAWEDAFNEGVAEGRRLAREAVRA